MSPKFALLFCAFILLLLPASHALSQESPLQPLTRAEARLHLFPESATPPRVDTGFALQQESKKSVGLAAIYSLLLPGMGELYAGGFESGKYFLIAEAALWLGYVGVEVYGNNLRDDARTYAVVHAGIDRSGKDDQFYIDIGNFMDVEAYNDKRLRDREADKLYDPLQGYAWRWDSEVSRSSYKDDRLASETAYNSRKFIGAVILINHVASAINAARAAISHNNALNEVLGELDIHADLVGGYAAPQGFRVTLTRQF